VPCASPAFIRKHFPHPEVLAGVAAQPVVSRGVTKRPAPFNVSVVTATPVLQQQGTETDNVYGSGAFSIQDNEFFKGTNGVEDGVQFTNQTNGSFLGLPLSGVCIWQIVIPAQNYNNNVCETVLGAFTIESIEGTVYRGQLTVGWIGQRPGLSTFGVAVVSPDAFGLGLRGRWNNSSGSILGVSKSQAQFSNTEEQISVAVSSCLDDAGFIAYSVFCKGTLKPGAYASYSPGPSTNNYQTVETNNLVPVIGSPPGTLPALKYFYGGKTALLSYVATTTGKCWTGKPPTCT
jgi:hypothetical protein